MNPVVQMTEHFRRVLGIREQKRRPKNEPKQSTFGFMEAEEVDLDEDDNPIPPEMRPALEEWLHCKDHNRMIKALLIGDCDCGPQIVFLAARILANNMPGEEAVLEEINEFDGTSRKLAKIVSSALTVMTKNGLTLKCAKLKLCDVLRLVHQMPPSSFRDHS